MRSNDLETIVCCPETETTDLARVKRKRRKRKASIEKERSILPTRLTVISREPGRRPKKVGQRRKRPRNGARRIVSHHKNRKVKMRLAWMAKRE
jgi:hypothetical protein